MVPTCEKGSAMKHTPGPWKILPDPPPDTESLDAGDLEQLQQEDALFPWLADGSMSDSYEDMGAYHDA
jgi:hypothetical protein